MKGDLAALLSRANSFRFFRSAFYNTHRLVGHETDSMVRIGAGDETLKILNDMYISRSGRFFLNRNEVRQYLPELDKFVERSLNNGGLPNGGKLILDFPRYRVAYVECIPGTSGYSLLFTYLSRID